MKDPMSRKEDNRRPGSEPDHTQQTDADQDSPLSVSDALRKKLETRRIPHRWIEHEPVYTMDQAAEVCGHAPEQGVKVLMAIAEKDGQSEPVLIVWTGNKKVNFKSIAMQAGVTKVSMASPAAVKETLGIEIGALTPFGYERSLPVYFHAQLLAQPKLYINPGVHNATVELGSNDLHHLIEEWSGQVIMMFNFNNL